MSTTRPYIGGQAVLEGVMMRSPTSVAVVCRRRGGALSVREQPMPSAKPGPKRWPLVRGIASLVESLKLGSRALRWSAELYEEDRPESTEAPGKAGRTGAQTLSSVSRLATLAALSVVALVRSEAEEAPPSEEASAESSPVPGAPSEPRASSSVKDASGGSGLMTWLPLAFALLLFVALPQAAAEGISKALGLGLSVTSAPYQVITGASKLVIVVGYLLAIRRIDDVRRVFQYHGAEHKTISAYEAGEELLVANARSKTTMHPRCGTTFLVMVALVSILVFTALGSFLPTLPGGRLLQSVGFFAMKLPFLPVIAAITFEIQRVFARHCTVGPLRALLVPGFLVQKITTAEPDDAQLEVALASLRVTLWREDNPGAPVLADRSFEDYESLRADPGRATA